MVNHRHNSSDNWLFICLLLRLNVPGIWNAWAEIGIIRKKALATTFFQAKFEARCMIFRALLNLAVQNLILRKYQSPDDRFKIYGKLNCTIFEKTELWHKTKLEDWNKHFRLDWNPLLYSLQFFAGPPNCFLLYARFSGSKQVSSYFNLFCFKHWMWFWFDLYSFDLV